MWAECRDSMRETYAGMELGNEGKEIWIVERNWFEWDEWRVKRMRGKKRGSWSYL